MHPQVIAALIAGVAAVTAAVVSLFRHQRKAALICAIVGLGIALLLGLTDHEPTGPSPTGTVKCSVSFTRLADIAIGGGVPITLKDIQLNATIYDALGKQTVHVTLAEEPRVSNKSTQVPLKSNHTTFTVSREIKHIELTLTGNAKSDTGQDQSIIGSASLSSHDIISQLTTDKVFHFSIPAELVNNDPAGMFAGVFYCELDAAGW
jgi:hypothetical protein